VGLEKSGGTTKNWKIIFDVSWGEKRGETGDLRGERLKKSKTGVCKAQKSRGKKVGKNMAEGGPRVGKKFHRTSEQNRLWGGEKESTRAK